MALCRNVLIGWLVVVVIGWFLLCFLLEFVTVALSPLETAAVIAMVKILKTSWYLEALLEQESLLQLRN